MPLTRRGWAELTNHAGEGEAEAAKERISSCTGAVNWLNSIALSTSAWASWRESGSKLDRKVPGWEMSHSACLS